MPLQILLLSSFAPLLLALAQVGRTRALERRVLGRPIHRARASKRGRRALVLLALLMAALAPVAAPDFALACVPLLAGAALLLELSPRPDERACGAEGVRSGWELCALGELREWRLTGDHLRFRGRGEWSAVDLPRELHEAMRARLEAACPGRESRFAS